MPESYLLLYQRPAAIPSLMLTLYWPFSYLPTLPTLCLSLSLSLCVCLAFLCNNPTLSTVIKQRSKGCLFPPSPFPCLKRLLSTSSQESHRLFLDPTIPCQHPSERSKRKEATLPWFWFPTYCLYSSGTTFSCFAVLPFPLHVLTA